MVNISNTREFIKAITADSDIGYAINKWYDEIMVLYHILNGREDVEIHTNGLGGNPASFILLMDSKKAAFELAQTMREMSFSVYGDVFHVHMESHSASVYVTIERASK